MRRLRARVDLITARDAQIARVAQAHWRHALPDIDRGEESQRTKKKGHAAEGRRLGGFCSIKVWDLPDARALPVSGARIRARSGGVQRARGAVVALSAHAVAATVTSQRLDLLREADAIVMQALERHHLYDSVWQCPTVLVPCSLTYAHKNTEGELVVVRPVASQRAMTARPVKLPKVMIEELRSEILMLDGVTGLALDLTSKPPGTIEWE